MDWIELPHTSGCVVCGPSNPHGLHLSSHVDVETGSVRTTFTPAAHHVGFDDLVHGGVLATVMDEVMVWAAIWACRRACVAGEFGVRFRQKATPGRPLVVSARVTRSRGKLHEVDATVVDVHGSPVVTGSGKYLSGSAEETADFLRTVLPSESTRRAVELLTRAA